MIAGTPTDIQIVLDAVTESVARLCNATVESFVWADEVISNGEWPEV